MFSKGSFHRVVKIRDCVVKMFIESKIFFLPKMIKVLDNVFFYVLPVFTNFYTPVEDGTYYGITRGGQAGVRAGGRRPVLCPEHISKTTLARVMKFHGWIDLIQGRAVRRNHNSCLLNF